MLNLTIPQIIIFLLFCILDINSPINTNKQPKKIIVNGAIIAFLYTLKAQSESKPICKNRINKKIKSINALFLVINL